MLRAGLRLVLKRIQAESRPQIAFYWPGFLVVLLGLSKVQETGKLERGLRALGRTSRFLAISGNSWPVSSVLGLHILYSLQPPFWGSSS